MLVLSRKKDQQIFLQLGGEIVVIRVVTVKGERVRFGIAAPPKVIIHREEVARQIPEFQVALDKLQNKSTPRSKASTPKEVVAT